MIDGLEYAYRTLGLAPGASPAEAVGAHAQLVAATEQASAESRVFDDALGWILDHYPGPGHTDGIWDAGTPLDRGVAPEGHGPDLDVEADTVLWRSAGWPITFGSVGAGLATSGFGAGVLAAGIAGEVEVAAAIDVSIERADAFVFHSVTPSGGDGDVDHAIVCGDLLICIDAKRWAPGRYESVHGPNGMAAYRDGELFPAGSASSSAFLAGLLAEDLAWPGRVARIIAVTSSGGRGRPVDLSGYTHPDATAVAVEQLPEVIDRLLGSTTRQGYTAAAVRSLAARTATATVRSPLVRPDPDAEPPLVDPAAAARRAPAPLDYTAGMARIRLSSLTYLALLALDTILVWVVGDLSAWPARVLAAATAGAGGWVLLHVGDVETGTGAAHRAMAELVALRRALALDRSVRLSPMGRRKPLGPGVAVVGLGASGIGILYLFFLRQGAWVDLSRLAGLVVIAGAVALVTAVWSLLERDVAAVNLQLGHWTELWVEAVRVLAVVDPRAASAALAVLVDHPDGVLDDHLDAWESDAAVTAMRMSWAGGLIREGGLVIER